MTPLDVKTKEEWEEILNRFATAANMTTCLTDPAGGQLLCVFDRYPLCAAIRENEDALTFICSQTNTAMAAVATKTRKPLIELCEAGLIKAVLPVIRNDQVVGFVSACGTASEEEEVDSFLVSKEVGISEEKAMELAAKTPFGSEEELEQLCARFVEELNPA